MTDYQLEEASKSYLKMRKRIISKDPDLEKRVIEIERNLINNHFERRKGSKKKGNLKDTWTQRLNGDYRILYKIDKKIFRLLKIGSHTKVY